MANEEKPIWFTKIVDQYLNEEYLIKKGVRSCAMFAIGIPKNDDIYFYLSELETMIARDGLQCSRYMDNVNTSDDTIVYILYVFKYSHQKLIIEYIERKLTGYIYQWALGKLLGYSDEEMERFLSEFFFNNSMDKE